MATDTLAAPAALSHTPTRILRILSTARVEPSTGSPSETEEFAARIIAQRP